MKTRNVTAWLSIVSIAAAIVAIILVGAIKNYRRERRAQARQTTIYALARLQGYLTDYMTVHGELPGPNLDDAMKSLEEEGSKYYQIHGVKIATPGLDAWGHAIIYELRDSKHAILRSVGENGVDERGGGDDIEFDVPLK